MDNARFARLVASSCVGHVFGRMVWFGGLASVVVARCFEPGGGRMIPCLDTGGSVRSAVPFSFWVFYFHTGSRLL